MLALAGCNEDLENLRRYTAVVESVEATSPMMIEEYSITNGREPATYITLHLASGASGRDGSRVRIIALGLHDPDAYGRPGETVAFSATNLLMQNGTISIGRLSNYRVVRGSSLGDTLDQRHGDNQKVDPGRP